MKLKFGQPVPDLDTLVRGCDNDSDTEIVLNIWEMQGLKLTKEQKDYIKYNCYAPETITRAKRKLKEKGEL